MTNANPNQVTGLNPKQTGRELVQDKDDVQRVAAGGADPLTGAGDRPASGYPEHNPRPEQHQAGGGIDQDEVGDDLEDDDWEDDDLESDNWEGDDQDEPDGYQKNPGFDKPQIGDDVEPDGGAKPIRF